MPATIESGASPPRCPAFPLRISLVPSENGTLGLRFQRGRPASADLHTLTGALCCSSPTMRTAIRPRSPMATATSRPLSERGRPDGDRVAGGERTMLATDANGWLSRITDPANESRSLQSSAGGLLQQLTDPRANVRHFSYDSAGRLTRDEDAAGGSTTLARSEQANGFTVTTTTALGRSRSYQFEGLSDGSQRRTFVATDGTTTVARTAPDGSAQITLADGTVATIQSGPDPVGACWRRSRPSPSRCLRVDLARPLR